MAGWGRGPRGWLAAGLAGKCLYEVATGDLLLPLALGPHLRPAPVAHLAGACVGLGALACRPRAATA